MDSSANVPKVHNDEFDVNFAEGEVVEVPPPPHALSTVENKSKFNNLKPFKFI